MKIKAVIITSSSKTDVNGNWYHYARIVNTATGQALLTEVGSPSNARHVVSEVLIAVYGEDARFDYEDVEVELPIRLWNARYKSVDLYEHQVGPELVKLFNPELYPA